MTGLFTHTLTLFNKRLSQIALPISERGLLRRFAIVLLALAWSTYILASWTTTDGGDHISIHIDNSIINGFYYDNSSFRTDGYGDMCSKADKTGYQWYSSGYFNDIRHVNITEGVTSIGQYSFDGYENLVLVRISSTVTSIGTCAFRNCLNLNTVIFYGNGTSSPSGNDAFTGVGTLSNPAILYAPNISQSLIPTKLGLTSTSTSGVYLWKGGYFRIRNLAAPSSWDELSLSLEEGTSNITLAGDCIDQTRSQYSYLKVANGKTITLDLNGKTINRNLESAIYGNRGYVIYNEGNLTITDGSSGGTGTITGGFLTGHGAGITNENTGVLTINGGTITGNNGGGILSPAGSVAINGGKIINNTNGFGIYTQTISLSGKVLITGNTNGSETQNLCLGGNIGGNNLIQKITITDNIDATTRIGITSRFNCKGVFTDGLENKGSIDNFTSDAASYIINTSGSELKLEYVISSVAITNVDAPVTCQAFDTSPTYPNTVRSNLSSMIWKNGDTTVEGTANANIAYTVVFTLAKNNFYDVFLNTTTATVNGNAASATLNNDSKLVVSYTFPETTKLTPTITTAPTASGITYGQTLASSTLSSGVASVDGSFAWTTPTTLPNAGTPSYSVTFTPTDGTNYNTQTTNVSVNVGKKAVTISGITASDKVYDGTTTATINTTEATLDGKLANDDLTVSTSGTFSDKTVGVGKTVTFGALTLGGTSKDNYQLAASGQQETTTADITAKTAELNWSDESFDYDGTAKAPTCSVSNLVDGDNCNVTVSVGVHSAVGTYTATASGLTGADRENYALPAANTQVYEIVRPMTGIEFTASKHWNTYYAFENLATPTGLTAYIVTGVNGTAATTSEIGYIPEGVGVLLYSANVGSDFKASAYTGAAGSFTANKLNGSTSATALDSEAGYILYGDAFVLTTGGTLPANRCYLPVNIGASTRSLTIDGGDGTTSLYKVNIEEMGDDKWFDLQGQRIEKPKKKGLYIHDGKKVVIK